MAKKIGIAALVLVLAVGIALGVIWRRVTALPEWYESGEMIADDGTPRVDDDWVRIPPSEAGPRRVKGETFQLRNPHLRAPERDEGAQLREVVKQSRAVYSKSKNAFEAGAVVNMSDMDVDELSESERARYEDTIEAFPALTGRDVYIGVEGDVRNQGGEIVFGPKAKLRVGDTRYSIKTAAKRLGLSEAELRKTLADELGRMNIDLPGQ